MLNHVKKYFIYVYIYINGTSEWVDDEVLAKTTGCMCKLPIKKCTSHVIVIFRYLAWLLPRKISVSDISVLVCDP